MRSQQQESLKICSYRTLLAGARASAPGVEYDAKGYAVCWQKNLARDLPLLEIAGDFAMGAGRELDSKLCAAHSSAALVINTFGSWRTDPTSFRFGDLSGFRALRFETTCPIWLGRTPPHLDVLAEGDAMLAIESKCTEWLNRKAPTFSNSYDHLRKSCGFSPWFQQIDELRAQPDRYRYLDAAQLVKHALGLMGKYGTREVRLIYLYWEPRNSEGWEECRLHSVEAQDLASRVCGSTVRLVPMSYADLFNTWTHAGAPPHAPYLRMRYVRDA